MSTWKQAWSWLSARAHAAAQPTHLIGLSLFRVLCGLNILGQYLLVYHQRHFLFGNEGMIPYAYYVEGVGSFPCIGSSTAPPASSCCITPAS